MRIARFTNVLAAGMILWVIPAAVFCQDGNLRGWVDALESENFKERVEAQQHLAEWGQANPAKAKEFLLRELDAAGSPESRMRLRDSLMALVIGEHQKTKGQGYLGITMEDVIVGPQGPKVPNSGVMVKQVAPDSPAADAGLKAEDIILKLDKFRWDGPGATEAFVAEVKKLKPGQEVQLDVLRGGELLKMSVKLGARPMGMPDRQPAKFINGFNPVPDFEMMGKLEKEARESFFKDWLAQQRQRPVNP